MASPQVERNLGYALLALGVILYLIFGLVKGAATDIGVYALTIVPLVLGLGFLWRATDPDPEQ